MTRKLEELLNLAKITEDSPTIEETQDFIQDNQLMIAEVDSAIDKIDAAMPAVRSLDTTDDEMDTLANIAKTRAEDLLDLGMNVDPRFAGVILQTASTMLGLAITAKTAKMDRKIRTLTLQMAKAKLDHQIAKDNNKASGPAAETPVDGQGIVLDRNELLRQILNNQSSQK